MFYLFLVIIAVLGIGIYLLFILPNVPGAVEERLGVLEPLPEDLGRWKTDQESPEGQAALARGQTREIRTLFEEQSGRLVHQARYRDQATGEIVAVDPDQRVKRRRIKPPNASG